MNEMMEQDVLVETYTYKRVGECEVQLEAYRAPALLRPAAGLQPAILWLHGGSLVKGNRHMLAREHYREQLRRYQAAGYRVISADYRLAPETKLPGIIEDVQDAYRWVLREGPTRLGIDPKLIAVVGHSAGGYLTLTAGWCVEPRPRCLVSFYGYGDVTGDWNNRPKPATSARAVLTREEAFQAISGPPVAQSLDSEGRRAYLRYVRQEGLWLQEVTGIAPTAGEAAFDPFCPLRHVSALYPPTLLLHGDMDPGVPCEQSVRMAEALAAHGVPHRLILLPGRAHGFDKVIGRDAEVDAAFDEVLSFLKQHLAPVDDAV